MAAQIRMITINRCFKQLAIRSESDRNGFKAAKRWWIVFFTAAFAACANFSEKPDWLAPDLMLVPAVEFSGERYPTLRERMERYGVPGVSIALIEGGKIVVREALGLKDTNSVEQISPDMVFQAASISKPVSAFGVMILVDHQQVELDAPANTYLKTWTIPESEFTHGDPVTLRELLSHSGGVSVPSYPGFERGAELPSVGDILIGAPNAYSDPVEVIRPQGTYRYSGGGFMILQKVVEDISGEPFERFMQRTVFGPLGMPRSTFKIMTETDGIALGHDWRGKRRNDPWQDYPQSAPAGLWSTPEELARWLVAYGSAYRQETESVISSVTARNMAQRVTGDTGLGFGVHGEGNALHLSHAGWTIGYRSYMLYFPERGDGVVIMTNGDGGQHLIDDLLRTLGRERRWPYFGESVTMMRAVWPNEKMDAIAGAYCMSPAGFSVTLARVGDEFELTTSRGSLYRAIPIDSDHLIMQETGDRIVLDNATGKLSFWDMTALPVADVDTRIQKRSQAIVCAD